MAVGAAHFALGQLGENRGPGITTSRQQSHTLALRGRIDVVTFQNHRICGAAIDTRMIAQERPQAPLPLSAPCFEDAGIAPNVIGAVHPIVLAAIRVEALAAARMPKPPSLIAQMELLEWLCDAAPTADPQPRCDHRRRGR